MPVPAAEGVSEFKLVSTAVDLLVTRVIFLGLRGCGAFIEVGKQCVGLVFQFVRHLLPSSLDRTLRVPKPKR
jgi:hypothetical protein